MAESSKKPAAVSPYHEIKYNDPWYIDTEIPDLYEHLDVLQLALHKLDTETALLDSYTDEALQKNIQLLLLKDYEELQVQRYPQDVYLGDFVIDFDPAAELYALKYLPHDRPPLIIGHLPQKYNLQLKNILASDENSSLATQINGGPYKIITFEEGELQISERQRPYYLRVLVF